MTKLCELHTHTHHSDGLHDTRYVIKECARQGINYLAITDHCSLDAYYEKNIYEFCKKNNIELINGVEIFGDETEILGYYFNKEYEPLVKIIEECSEKHTDLNIQKIYWLKDNGYDIDVDDVLKHTGPTNNVFSLHIALELKNKGYVQVVQEAYETIFRKIKIDVVFKRTKIKKIISEIKNSGGVAVLPHPWFLSRARKEGIEDYLIRLKGYGLDGVETIGPYDIIEKDFVIDVKKIAKKLDLVECGGSDFHSLNLFPQNKIGDFCVSESVLEALKKKIIV